MPGTDQTVYLVIDHCLETAVFREAIVQQTDRETVLDDLMSGQYGDPLHVIAFDVQKGSSQIVSGEFAAELQKRADLAHDDLPNSVVGFVQTHLAPERQLTLRLVSAR